MLRIVKSMNKKNTVSKKKIEEEKELLKDKKKYFLRDKGLFNKEKRIC